MSAAMALRPRGDFMLPCAQAAGCNVELKDETYGTALRFTDGQGGEDVFIRWAPTADLVVRAWWEASRWTLHKERVDAQGDRWTACGGHYVIDDFGFLVQVPE